MWPYLYKRGVKNRMLTINLINNLFYKKHKSLGINFAVIFTTKVEKNKRDKIY